MAVALDGFTVGERADWKDNHPSSDLAQLKQTHGVGPFQIKHVRRYYNTTPRPEELTLAKDSSTSFKVKSDFMTKLRT